MTDTGASKALTQKAERQKSDKITRKFENVDVQILKIRDEDLRPFIMNIYRTDLGSLRNLKTLILERCQLDIFAPREMSDKLRYLSLEGNRLDRLEVQFGVDKDEYLLENVKLKSLNLSSNNFSEFPYKALKFQPRIMHLDLSRNKIGNLDPSLKFNCFQNLRELDLSSNRLDQFPVNIKDCPKLKVFRCIYNQITTIPNEFYQSECIQENLQHLILNVNPLTELSGLVRYLKNLKVLGIAHTKIQELPPQIANLNKMEQIVVENTPLRVPKLVTAERGFEAIKEFFLEQKQRKDQNAGIAQEEPQEIQENQNIKISKTLKERLLSNDSEEEDHSVLEEEKKFVEYEQKKNQLVSKEFAYAVIQQMRKKQDIDLYNHKTLMEFKDKEHEFVQAYDDVLKKYIEQDNLNMLPDIFKKNQVVQQRKNRRRALRFEFEAIKPMGSQEDQKNFVNQLNNTMIDDQLNRAISLIRFQNFELFKILIELIKRMDIYKLKFVITYVTTYLEEFLLLYDKKAQIDPKLISYKDEFNTEMQIRKKDTYEIDINNQIFYNKIGQYPQLMTMFQLMNFKRELNKQNKVIKLKIEKTDTNYKTIKEITNLLRLVQSVNF